MGLGIGNAGSEQGKRQIVPAVYRQIRDGSLLDHVRLPRTGGFDRWSIRDHLYSLRGSDREMNIPGCFRAHLKRQILQPGFLKTIGFGVEIVIAGGHQIETVKARGIGFSLPFQCSAGIDDADARTRNHGIAGIQHRSAQRGGVTGLSECDRRQKEQQRGVFHDVLLE